MARSKSKKLEEVKNLFNVFTYETENIEEKIVNYFNNDNPYIIEIGCGEGDYSIRLAEKNKDINYIGLDLKGARIHTASRYSKEKELKNVCFLMMEANLLPEKLKKLKFSEIWIPFSDPFPKKKYINKRLVSPPYLEVYKNILTEDGIVNFKTDDDGLYQYACELLPTRDDVETIQNLENVYDDKVTDFDKEIQTKYEKQHLAEGKIIKFIKFRFNNK